MIGRPRTVLLVCTVLIGTFVVCLAAGRMFTYATAAPPANTPRVEEFDFDAGTLRFTGSLDAHAAGVLRGADVVDGLSLVLLIEADDVATCEDLGRQLRELRRAYDPSRSLTVLAPEADTEIVREFLRRERIGSARLHAVADTLVMSDRRPVPTPAALLVDRGGRVVEGVAHPVRAPNVRLRSFADEMTSLSARE